jgi:branched-chain amino acid aminotransferase
MSDFVHLNGQLLPYDDARIAPADAGLLHGAGLFETMRAKNGKIFRRHQHLQRLANSAHALNIPFALSETQLAEIAADLLEANGLADARLRLTITRGDLHEATPVTLLLTAAEFLPYPPALYEKGMTVILSRHKQNPESPLTGHKTTSYFDRLLALREAQELKAGEALWFTPHTNLLAEASISNVFLVLEDGILATPPLPLETPPLSTQHSALSTRLCLPGTTRQLTLELASSAGILPHERPLTINDLLAAKEVFLTNAIMGLMPVTHIEKHTVADGAPGSLTQQLRTAYEQAIASETT